MLWTYHAHGAVKASPTLTGGVLYFGDYSGHVQAVGESTGRLLWLSGSGGALLGSGTFYSTPAVIYGRVFLGNTDGRVYAYDAATGKLDWAVQTGAYVYASPAVTQRSRPRPDDLPGLLRRHLLCPQRPLGAHRRGSSTRAARSPARRRSSGNTVYFADLGTHRTIGLGISTGRRLQRAPAPSTP